MRGYSDTAKLTNEAYIDAHPDGPRAVLRVAGHGTFYGEPRQFQRDAAKDLVELQAKHIPKAVSANGFSAKQEADITAALISQSKATRESVEARRAEERSSCRKYCHPETCNHSWAQ